MAQKALYFPKERWEHYYLDYTSCLLTNVGQVMGYPFINFPTHVRVSSVIAENTIKQLNQKAYMLIPQFLWLGNSLDAWKTLYTEDLAST